MNLLFFLFCCGCCWILFHFGPLLLWKLGLKSVFLMSFHPDSVGLFSYFYFQNVKVKTNVLNTCWVNFSGAVVWVLPTTERFSVGFYRVPNSNVSILKKKVPNPYDDFFNGAPCWNAQATTKKSFSFFLANINQFVMWSIVEVFVAGMYCIFCQLNVRV